MKGIPEEWEDIVKALKKQGYKIERGADYGSWIASDHPSGIYVVAWSDECQIEWRTHDSEYWVQVQRRADPDNFNNRLYEVENLVHVITKYMGDPS